MAAETSGGLFWFQSKLVGVSVPMWVANDNPLLLSYLLAGTAVLFG